jgi:hypothetical protein
MKMPKGFTVWRIADMSRNQRAREERYHSFLHALDNNKINSRANTTYTDPLAHTRPQANGMMFEPMSDAELMSRINYLTPKIKRNTALCTVFIIIGFVLSTYVRITAGEILAFGVLILFFAAGFSFGVSAKTAKNRLKNIVSNNIVRGVLTETFDLTNYSPGCHIGQNQISWTGLIQQSWNRINGSDLVQGSYKGVRFSFSDVHLEQVTKSRKGGQTRTTRFKGQWLIVDLAKELPWVIQLRERGMSVSKRAKSDIETENIEFNRRFHISTRDPHTAFYLLTPHFMEYILGADNRANAHTFMSFGGRQVHIALHNGRDLFEPFGKKLFAMKNIQTLRMQMQWDANYIAGIIDELLQNECLFGTGAADDE